jgi:phosphate transport system substrate-binding protein
MQRIWTGASALVLGATLLSACGGDGNRPVPGQAADDNAAGGAVSLTGAGATFPYPVYSKWFDTYGQANAVRVNYQSIGSGGGIRQITEKTVDFGASDAPMSEEELQKAPGTLHLPTVLGAVTAAYNLPEVTQPLNLSGELIAAMYRGEVKKWNDARVAAENPGVALPATDVLPVYRSDGSGTTYVFTDFLSAVSPAWKTAVGTGKSVKWPEGVGLGAKGNEGVAGQVKQTPGALGYVELAYAMQTGLQTAAVRNRAGRYVRPTLEATTAAGAGVAGMLAQRPDFRLSIVNAEGADAYPISSWTYLLVPQHVEDCAKGRALAGVVRWALTEGGQQARDLHYAPLPDAVRDQVLAKLGTVTCGAGNEPVLPAQS